MHGWYLKPRKRIYGIKWSYVPPIYSFEEDRLITHSTIFTSDLCPWSTKGWFRSSIGVGRLTGSLHKHTVTKLIISGGKSASGFSLGGGSCTICCSSSRIERERTSCTPLGAACVVASGSSSVSMANGKQPCAISITVTPRDHTSVSYTHLTLPTIYSV